MAVTPGSPLEVELSDSRLVVPFSELGMGDVPLAGGKGASLGELTRAGASVPPGCVVTTHAYREVLDAVDAGAAVRGSVAGLDPADHGAVVVATARVRDLVAGAPLSGRIVAAVRDGYAAIAVRAGTPTPPVAVRSSATSEDGADTSFAGMQDTFLWVVGADAVVEHLRRCWASLYSVESVTYRLRRGVGEDGLAMAVAVQLMVDARTSGVMFTCSPLTGDRSVIFVEASWGLGSAVVSGEVTPDSWVVDKVTGAVVKSSVSTKLRRHRADPAARTVVDEEVPEELRAVASLRTDELHALVAAGRAVERHYGAPQDIEWAIADGAAPGEGLFLLQSRPETVWSASRRAAPVAGLTGPT